MQKLSGGAKRAAKPRLEYGVRLVEPAQAGRILERAPLMPRRNRRMIAEVRARLARGEMPIDGEAVVVRDNGSVIHGAEKLYACLDLGIALPTVLITGLSEGSPATSGFFARRTRADYLQAEGVADAATVASAYNILDLIGRLGVYQVRVPSQMPHENIRHYQQTLGDLADEIAACRAVPARLIPRALAVVCLVLASQVDYERAFAFFAEIGRAAAGEKADPAAALLVRTLVQYHEEKAGGLRDRAVLVGFVFEAWRHYAAGRTPKRFAFEGRRVGRGYADFPEVVGLDRIEFPEVRNVLIAEMTADLKRAMSDRHAALVAASRAEVELDGAIAPERAAEWLDRFNTRNRGVRPSYVERYRRALRTGWELNGKTIKFSADLLRDGQHRLLACVEEGVPFASFVVRGLDEDVFVTLDQQGRVTLRDLLAREGFTNAQSLAAALSALALFPEETGLAEFAGSPDARVGDLSFEEQQRFIAQRHPRLVASAERYGSTKAYVGLLASGVVVAMHYLLGREDRDLADAFFDQLRLEPGRGDPSHNAQVLRAALTRNALSSRKRAPKPREQAELIRLAWDATREGRRLTNKAVAERL